MDENEEVVELKVTATIRVVLPKGRGSQDSAGQDRLDREIEVVAEKLFRAQLPLDIEFGEIEEA